MFTFNRILINDRGNGQYCIETQKEGELPEYILVEVTGSIRVELVSLRDIFLQYLLDFFARPEERIGYQLLTINNKKKEDKEKTKYA